MAVAILTLGTVTACTTPGTGSAAPSTTPTTISGSVPGPGGPDCTPLVWKQGGNYGANCDLRNLTVDGIDLSPSAPSGGPSGNQTYAPEAWLEGSTFTNSNFRLANFKYSHAKGVSFIDSDLSQISLPDTDLTNAVFRNVDLSGAYLGGATVTGATFTGVTVDSNTVCPDRLDWDPVDGCRGSLGDL